MYTITHSHRSYISLSPLHLAHGWLSVTAAQIGSLQVSCLFKYVHQPWEKLRVKRTAGSSRESAVSESTRPNHATPPSSTLETPQRGDRVLGISAGLERDAPEDRRGKRNGTLVRIIIFSYQSPPRRSQMWLWNRWLGPCTKSESNINKAHTHTHMHAHPAECLGSCDNTQKLLNYTRVLKKHEQNLHGVFVPKAESIVRLLHTQGQRTNTTIACAVFVFPTHKCSIFFIPQQLYLALITE